MKSSSSKQYLTAGAWGALTMGLALLLPQCLLLPEEGFQGDLVPNNPPVAQITGGVLRDSLDTEIGAHFYWFGADADGVVQYFEWAIDDTISENAWTRTTEYDVEIFFTATTPIDLYNYSDWHTFYIRSVDDDRARSAPDHRYFNAHTIAPTTKIEKPKPEIDAKWGKTLKFSWVGEDLDAVGADKLPAWYELKLVHAGTVEAHKPAAVRHHFEIMPNLLLGPRPSEYPDSTESEFHAQAQRAWERLPGTVTHRWITFAGTEGLFFAIRAIDEAGAREQEMRRTVNWVDFTPTDRIIEVRISEASLGVKAFNTPAFGTPWEVTVAAGQRIRFRWTGDASKIGTDSGPCNFGFDLDDPNNPAESERATDGMGGWIGWAMRTQMPNPVRFMDEGAEHYFYFKMRDISNNEKTETQAVIKIKVASFDFSRKFLIVDDVRDGPRDRAGNMPTDAEQDAWRYLRSGDESWGILSGLDEHLPSGESAGDHFIYGDGVEHDAVDVHDTFLDVLGRYHNVLWDCSHGRPTGFRKAVDEMYLTAYVGLGGNMLLLMDNGPVYAVTRDFSNRSSPKKPEKDDVIAHNAWTVYGFLYVQLHLRGPVWRPSDTDDNRRPRQSMVRATAANPLYPDLPFDFSRWEFGSFVESALQSYECLYETSTDQTIIPWYDREEGLEILYTTETWRAKQKISGTPVAWRTFVTPEDRAAGLDRGRVVCFAFHPYYFEPVATQGAMTLAINWLATGNEY